MIQLVDGPVPIRLEDLILDPALQCREAMSEEGVAEYSAAMKAGAVFPALKVVRVDGRHLVTDGWHRLLAARRAVADLRLSVAPEDGPRADALSTFPCEVTPGTWLDALRAAAGANPHHGLRRTAADKRRAVRSLLMHPECCGLSSRELAAIAGVTHTHVQDVRRHYGLDVGALLTDEHQAEVDGEMPLRWRPAFERLVQWQAEYVEKIRRAASIPALARLCSGDQYWQRGGPIRAAELATNAAWPWKAFDTQPEHIARRIERLDTERDLVDAVQSAVLTPEQRAGLYQVLHDWYDFQDGRGNHRLVALVEAWANRPRMHEEAQKRQAELERADQARQRSDPYRVWQAVTAEKDPEKQAEKLREAWVVPGVKNAAQYSAGGLLPAVRDTVFRELKTATVKGKSSPCPDPNCGGWAPGSSSRAICVKCKRPADGVKARMEADLRGAGALVVHAGFGVRVDGVVLDAASVELLGAIRAVLSHPEGGAALLNGAPTELRRRLRIWAARKEPEILLVDVGRPGMPDTDADTDEAEDLAVEDLAAEDADACPECAGEGLSEDGWPCPECQLTCSCNPNANVNELGDLPGCAHCHGRGSQFLGWIARKPSAIALPNLAEIDLLTGLPAHVIDGAVEVARTGNPFAGIA